MINKALTLLSLTGVLLGCPGCPPYRDANVPNAITHEIEPEAEVKYRLYVPSTYDRELAWPLVILCHGTKPWDNPMRQMLDWVKFAEEREFVVAAPELKGTRAGLFTRTETQIAQQKEDEDRILAVVRHISGAYNIADSRIFMTGWSAGNYAVAYTGLKHPEVFRALALQQGNFDPAFMGDAADEIDPYQPVAVIYGSADVITGEQARDALDWLGDHGVNVFAIEVSGGHRGHPSQTLAFFEQVLRNQPWLRIRTLAVEGADPLTVQFKTRSSFAPRAYQWYFGDGADSPVAEPIHRYDQPGTYRVVLEVGGPRDKKTRRAIELTVPQREALAAEPTTWDEEPSAGPDGGEGP